MEKLPFDTLRRKQTNSRAFTIREGQSTYIKKIFKHCNIEK